MANIPKPPSCKELDSLLRFTFDCGLGKVFGPSGKEVGNEGSDGYYRVSVTSDKGQRTFRRCHLIWWAKHNKWPCMEIDHDDRTKTNDSIGNLKESTRDANSANRQRPVHDLLPGVHFKPRMKTNPYASLKTVNKRVIHVGFFPTEQLAHEAYINYGK